VNIEHRSQTESALAISKSVLMLLQLSSISEIEARELTTKIHLIFLDSKKSRDAPKLDANLFPAPECSPGFEGALSFDGRMTNGPQLGKVSSLDC